MVCVPWLPLPHEQLSVSDCMLTRTGNAPLIQALLGRSSPATSAASHRHQLPQLREPALPDALDLPQLFHPGEAAVAGAPLEDPLRRDRPDPGKRIQLLDGGDVEVDLSGRGAAGTRWRRAG